MSIAQYVACYGPTGICTPDKSCTQETDRCFSTNRQDECNKYCSKQYYTWESGQCILSENSGCTKEDGFMCFRKQTDCELISRRLLSETNPIETPIAESSPIPFVIACILGLIVVFLMTEFKSSRK